jgi:dihydropteroate synthase
LTSRLPVIGRDALPPELPAGSRTYVKCLPTPWRTQTLGGDKCVEVLIRSTEAVWSVLAGLNEVEHWAGGLPDADTLRVTRQIGRARRPRPAIAGLDMAQCHVMGIINATPDSFSDGGQALAADAAEEQGLAMITAGASILDIGGESTRPGSDPVSEDDELGRVLPVIERLVGKGALISIDTRKASVMAAALDAGADVVNDVSALTHDSGALNLVAERGCPVVLMHALADSRTMQANPVYDHVSIDLYDYLEARIKASLAAGIKRERIIVDPGIGFGKTLAHNLALLRDLPLFHALGCPILLGASRKRFIGTLSGEEVASCRTGGSVAAALAGARAGAQFLRVHDVAETVQALSVWRAIDGMEKP